MGWNLARSPYEGASAQKNRVRQTVELQPGGWAWMCKVCGIHLNPQVQLSQRPRIS